MQFSSKQRAIAIFLVIIMGLTLAACGAKEKEASKSSGQAGETAKLRNVKIVLDWTPNTNHTGLYVAKEKGYYEQEGLNVDIIQSTAGDPNTLVGSGEVQFGVSVQESLTQARSQGVPIVSLAAIIQHNTSGFAAPQSKGITTPKDFEGKNYGGWGSPVEEAILRTVMEQADADYSKVKNVNIGEADYFTAVKRDIDFAWVFYGWTGIEAELRGEPVDMLYMNEFAKELDFYTPVIATNEQLIANDPELVKAFMKATAKGYQEAIEKPEEAADLLLKAVPDLDKELVHASQKWLSTKYQEDAPRWGEQKREVWDNYTKWLVDNKLMDKSIDVDKAFTNDFLPSAN
ncbi:ABC transporter substrate-binding protein [Paenibacillus agilis]|uniref:ABC transporter substrate-binding protein n=1 Tax=Paenibacillus agilis TaxID=3020863 RepID=A0A559IPK5_9BACL|nr:ABC transporter substrate-binding protein [Paenibacillus agilis]TVX89565.1 ABC transporter substrate-binding protein [Paenibacillus agilis]